MVPSFDNSMIKTPITKNKSYSKHSLKFHHPLHHHFKYPKLLILCISILFAIVLFQGGKSFSPFHDLLISLGYVGTFISGIFYAYGFTAAPATSILLILAKGQNIFIAALIGGIGALISDLIIFFFVRSTFMDEIEKLEREKVVKYIERGEKKIFGHYKKYILPVFAGILIATPLPTEVGVALMASVKNISVKKFMIIAYILHTIGIFIILSIGNLI